ncbi:MAG TPA: hypothetical protein VFE31_06425 [Opitutaceae bacterium]|jgi:hypothetical protein|nr:hypothetical protein [Opitutaceae bacterium]
MLKFLLVDNDREGFFYYGRTLLRKFPQAVLMECKSAPEALQLIGDPALSGVVCHGAVGVRAEELIPQLRRRRADLPIIWVSSGPAKVAARDIGADRYLPFEEWLMVGTLLGELIGMTSPPRPARTGR